jgi:hypothetical protein
VLVHPERGGGDLNLLSILEAKLRTSAVTHTILNFLPLNNFGNVAFEAGCGKHVCDQRNGAFPCFGLSHTHNIFLFAASTHRIY